MTVHLAPGPITSPKYIVKPTSTLITAPGQQRGEAKVTPLLSLIKSGLGSPANEKPIAVQLHALNYTEVGRPGEERELVWGAGEGCQGWVLHGETEPSKQAKSDKLARNEWPVRHQTNPIA